MLLAYEFTKDPRCLLTGLVIIHNNIMLMFCMPIATIYLKDYENTPYKLYASCIISLCLCMIDGELLKVFLILLAAIKAPEFIVLKKLSAKDELLLNNTYDACRKRDIPTLYTATKSVHWVSLYIDKNLEELENGSKELHNWVIKYSKNILEFYGLILDGYGFILNPPGSKNQKWHVDYSRSYTTVFIPMENYSSLNATMLLVNDYFRFLFREDIDEKLYTEKSTLTVHQIITPNFVPYILPGGTFHRGITNTSDQTRVSFYISYKSSSDDVP